MGPFIFLIVLIWAIGIPFAGIITPAWPGQRLVWWPVVLISWSVRVGFPWLGRGFINALRGK